MEFGELKFNITNILAESIVSKNKTYKKVASKIFSMIKENKELRTQYKTYTTIEKLSPNDGEYNTLIIKEGVDNLRGLNKEKTNKANRILQKEVDDIKNSLSFAYDGKIKELHDTFQKLVKSKKLSENVNHYKKINSLLTEQTKMETNNRGNLIPNSILLNVSMDKFNKKYTDLSETTKEVISSLLKNDDKAKENVLKKIKTECLEKVNDCLKENDDIEIKGKLLDTKERLIEMTYDNETFKSDVIKLINLKEDLSE